MNREGYTSKREAKRALMEHGYRPAFSSPGRPQLWIGPDPKRERVAVALARYVDSEQSWRIVPYPEPAVAGKELAAELAARDKVVGSDHVEIGDEAPKRAYPRLEDLV